MSAQTIVTPSGERLVVLPEAEFMALLDASEDVSDLRAVDAFRRDLASGREELIPADVVDRVLAGESRVRVRREHRGLSVDALARAAGVGQGFLSQIEAGTRSGTTETLRKLADALGVAIDDLAP